MSLNGHNTEKKLIDCMIKRSCPEDEFYLNLSECEIKSK